MALIRRRASEPRRSAKSRSLTVRDLLVDKARAWEVVFEESRVRATCTPLDAVAERRFYPAIDVQGSGTRREELLLDERTLKGVWLVRRMTAMISQSSPNNLEATERLLERIARTSTNDEFLSTLKTEL